jgi:hypothetical protein
MQLVDPTTAPLPAHQYTQQLAAARDRLAYVRQAPLDTPQRVDIALAHLHGATSGIHQALAGADQLPRDLPGGVTSFPREASTHLRTAVDEVLRATTGSPIDGALVTRSVDTAIAGLQRAIGLVVHPPSNQVYDGS